MIIGYRTEHSCHLTWKHTIGEPIFDMGMFFMAQPVVTLVEKVILDTYVWLVSVKTSGNTEVGCQGTHLSKILGGVSDYSFRVLGLMWVICWFGFIGWWFTEPYVAIGVMEWKVPFHRETVSVIVRRLSCCTGFL
jgi:hypothetical protein